MTGDHPPNTGPMLLEPALWGQNAVGQALRVSGGKRRKALPSHGGAPGSGAPRGNQNALKHGPRGAIEERRQLRALMRQSRMLI